MKLIQLNPDAGARGNLDDSMVPAINIVFLMLIFFMIAGQIKPQNDQLQVPEAASNAELAEVEIKLEINRQGEYYLQGELITGELADALQAVSISPATTVTCYVDKDLPATALDPVLESVRALGIQTLYIATEQSS